jgi:hypothetical protein
MEKPVKRRMKLLKRKKQTKPSSHKQMATAIHHTTNAFEKVRKHLMPTFSKAFVKIFTDPTLLLIFSKSP